MSFPLLRTWLGRSFWALMDQCLFAFSNFALNLYLGRWLEPESYGAFALAYTVFLFVGVVHTSVFTEPMLIFGSGRYKDSQKPYLRALVAAHWKLGWPGTALLISLVSLAYWNNPARPAILVLALVSGAMLYQWLMRRACYLRQQSELAAAGGFIYLVLVTCGIVAIYRTGQLGAIPALMVMAVSSMVSAAFIQWRLFRHGELTESSRPEEADLVRTHWDYGRWSIATGVIGWIAGNIAMVSLPWWHGNEATGTLRAASNLILPIQQLLAAAGPLLTPFLVGRRDSAGYRKVALACAALFMLPPLAWTILLGFFGPLAGDLLYDGKYSFDRSLLLALGIQATVGSFGLVMATSLRAMELPSIAFRGYAVSAAASLLVGLPLIAFMGLDGAAGSMVLAGLLSAVVLTHAFLRVMARKHART